MFDVPVAIQQESGGQSNERVSLSNRERMMRRAQILNFLKESAAYLRVAVSSGQLGSLIERT